MKKSTLADKISSILTTTPGYVDTEDAFEDGTNAKLNTELAEESDGENISESQFRKRNVDLLADVDERYAGKGGNRKHLDSVDDFETSGSDVNSENNVSDCESDNSNEGDKELDKHDGYDDYESGQSSDASGFEDSEEHSDNPELKDTTINFKTLKDSDVSSQVKKGNCVKNQMHVWENLLEMRIQMQKCLLAANKMPHYENYKCFTRESGEDFTAGVQKTKKSLSVLLEKLLLLQDLVWKKNSELKKNQSKEPTQDSDDEEIPSDTDDESNNQYSDENEEIPKKRLKFSDFEKDIQNKHDYFKEYRNVVIKKWHEKTRMTLMKNNTTTHSIINHIEHTLADKDKLVKRTQLKRSDYKILGEESDGSEKEDSLNETKSEKSIQRKSEIFDDDDFYHQLLRELIEFKSADLTDPVQLGRQWIQLQNLRSKMKRKIDTKATKGRKIRYAVHTKLVNFMAPIDVNLWTDEAKTELFGSLFGKTHVSAS